MERSPQPGRDESPRALTAAEILAAHDIVREERVPGTKRVLREPTERQELALFADAASDLGDREVAIRAIHRQLAEPRPEIARIRRWSDRRILAAAVILARLDPGIRVDPVGLTLARFRSAARRRHKEIVTPIRAYPAAVTSVHRAALDALAAPSRVVLEAANALQWNIELAASAPILAFQRPPVFDAFDGAAAMQRTIEAAFDPQPMLQVIDAVTRMNAGVLAEFERSVLRGPEIARQLFDTQNAVLDAIRPSIAAAAMAAFDPWRAIAASVDAIGAMPVGYSDVTRGAGDSAWTAPLIDARLADLDQRTNQLDAEPALTREQRTLLERIRAIALWLAEHDLSDRSWAKLGVLIALLDFLFQPQAESITINVAPQIEIHVEVQAPATAFPIATESPQPTSTMATHKPRPSRRRTVAPLAE